MKPDVYRAWETSCDMEYGVQCSKCDKELSGDDPVLFDGKCFRLCVDCLKSAMAEALELMHDQ